MSRPEPASSVAAPWGRDDYRFQHQPLLGTVVEIRVPGATEETLAGRISAAAAQEISRLQSIFSAFDPTSELERWKRGEVLEASPEFSAAMRTALDWQARSGGRFNTVSGEVTELWKRAERGGRLPSPAELDAVAATIAAPRFRIDGNGAPQAIGDCSGVNLNAFVKGWIVDRAVVYARAVAPGTDLLVNAGGDLRHAGVSPICIGIENPLRPYDNEPPLAIVGLCNAGLATSGRARRGFRIAGEWYSHVVDPRTGQTMDHSASISVIAADAATADVLATVAGLMEPGDAVTYAQELGAACLVIARDGSRKANELWSAAEVSRP